LPRPEPSGFPPVSRAPGPNAPRIVPVITSTRALIVLLLVLGASKAVAGEIPLSPIVYTGALGFQFGVQGASDGTNFLIVWRDSRAAIRAARVDPEGRLIDQPTGIRIADPFDSSPVVAWTGRVYLVAWEGAGRMLFVRIDAEGHVLDATPGTLGNLAASPTAAASSRNGAMIVYMGSAAARPSTNVHAALFDVDANVVKTDIPIPRASTGDAPVIASNDGSFYIAWRTVDGGRTVVMGALVSLDGVVGGATVIAATNSGPMLASNGSDFVVAFMDGQPQHLTVRHIDRQGTPLSGTVLPYTTSPRFDGRGNFIGRSGGGYTLAAFDRQQHPIGVVLDGDGAQTGEVPLPSAETVLISNVGSLGRTSRGAQHLRADRRQPGDGDAVVRRRGAANVRADRLRRQLLVVWLEVRGPDGSELRAGRLSLDGTPLDGEGIQLAENINAAPQVVFDGQNFVVAWSDVNAIVINQMTTGGILLDGLRGRVAVEGNQRPFALGSNGVESLLVWTATLNPFSFVPFIHAMRIARDSTLFPPVFIPTRGSKAESRRSKSWRPVCSFLI
jgi:hypothetical protein